MESSDAWQWDVVWIDDTNFVRSIFDASKDPSLIYFGTQSDDYFDAGNGIDTVVFNGNKEDYFIEKTIDGLIVSSLTEGTDTLIGVERLQFKDISVAFDIETNSGMVYRLYQAAFDRIPGPNELGYWIWQMDHGMSHTQVAEQFTQSDEFKLLYSKKSADGKNTQSFTNEEIVDLFYAHVLHDQPRANFEYYVNELNTNQRTLAQILVGFTESKENQDNVIGVIGNGFDYTPWGG
ncbi:MAG: DUF4214 domain-containing protein [Burkholderiaceae bacterium]|nr:DUF4214 domain-containing protein [Burkholderiaceae bacterium]